MKKIILFLVLLVGASAFAGMLLLSSATTTLWYPTDVSGLQIFFDYKDRQGNLAPGNFTKDGSNNISQWNDLSGNNRNATQATGILQPLYTASGVQFGSTQTLALGTYKIINDGADWTIFWVAQATTVDSTLRDFFLLQTSSDGHYLQAGITTLATYSDAFVGSTFEFSAPGSTVLTVSNTINLHNYIVLHTHNGGTGTFVYYLDGIMQSIVDPGGLDSLGPAALGLLFVGYERDFGVFNSVFSGSDLSNLQSYLNRRSI